MEENKFSAIIIGDRVITKIDNGQVNGLRITPLKWVQKSNASFHTDATITIDTNKEAARVIRDLIYGTLSYDDLIKTYF